MSLAAMCWAFDQQIKPSSAKFVLVCLSDNAHESTGEAWPSISTIVRRTCLDRKSVIDALDWLEELGVLSDTGKRMGSTKQVKVYRINGLPTIHANHYVYRVRHPNTGEYYIGCRSSWAPAEDDDKYFGSGVWPIRMRREKQPLIKEVLATFPNRRQAEIYEAQAITTVIKDPLCKNGNTGTIPKAELSRLWAETMPLFRPNSTENGTQNPNEPEVKKSTSGQPKGSPVAECFRIYAKGIKAKYGAEYPPSASANGMLAQVVKKLGAEAAKAVVQAYLDDTDPWYAKQVHDLRYLQRDCTKIWLRLQRAAGGAPETAVTEGRTYTTDAAGTERPIGPCKPGDPLAIAKGIAKDYGTLLAKRAAKGIIVQLGPKRHTFSVEELRR